jgi:hypothetical protein
MQCAFANIAESKCARDVIKLPVLAAKENQLLWCYKPSNWK